MFCLMFGHVGAKFKHELEWLGAHILSYYFVTLFSYSGTFVHCKSALKWMGEVVWEGAGMISHSVVHRSSAQVVMCSCSLHHHSAASTGTKYSTISTYPHTQCQARGTHTFQLHTYYNCLCKSYLNPSTFHTTSKKTSFSHFPPSLHSWCIKKRRLSRK